MTIVGHRLKLMLVLTVSAVFVSSCASPGPEPIRYGEDSCDYCRMAIVEKQFGSELVTKKGKVYKFDSIECLAAYLIEGRISGAEVHSRYVTDFNEAGRLIASSDAAYVHSDKMRSPMGVGLLACASDTKARTLAKEYDGDVVNWSALQEIVTEAWDISPHASEQ